MCPNGFDNILTALEDAPDHPKLLKLLIDIRKRVDADCPKNKENVTKIREKGSFKFIISSFHTSKRSIINVSLSILGNCCLDQKCARDVVVQFGILSNLNQLLKRYPKEDSINGRVFRIVGNICQHKDQWANIIIDKKPQIVIHIVKYLNDSLDDEDVSEATVIMGVRALRELLTRETLQVLIETHEVLKIVGMLLIKYGAKWQESKINDGVVINLIKLLHAYSQYRYYPSIVELRNTPKGDAIAYLSRILLIAPRQVVKIVMNFLKISKLKSDLPIPEIFNSFIEILRDETIIQDFNSTTEECVKCLCYLLDHPGNRENERCGDCIPILIKVLNGLTFESSRKIECCLLIIVTLKKCKYSDNLIAEQIKCNIVEVLNGKLKLIVGSVEPLIISHKKDKKRKSHFFKCKSTKKNKLKCEVKAGISIKQNNEDSSDSAEIESSSSEELEHSIGSDEEVDLFYSESVRYDHSPASNHESEMAMSWTSGLSPRSSPRSHFFELSESDSDDYSPVCSEVDPTDFSIEDDDFPNPDLDNKNSDVLTESEEIESFDIDSIMFKQLKVKVIMEIVDLLKSYIKIKPPVTQLGTPELLLRLVKSSCCFDWPSSSSVVYIISVIQQILESHDYLLPLMKSNFIPAVYDLSKIKHGVYCSKCHQFQFISSSVLHKLSKVAESGGGKGDIAHKLLRGDNDTKQQLVLAIPYIITNRTILMKLMLQCGGLEILIQLLRDNSQLLNKSIRVLCVLASKKLAIPNPRKLSCSYKTNLIKPILIESSTSVTFRLDDGSLLSADRQLLSKNSDFFARLLNGDFIESNQEVITLPNVTNKALSYLFRLMKSEVRSDLIRVDLDLNTHLDVIGLCDRFLMENYRVFLTDCVEKFRLSYDTIPIIYNWSLESRTNLLRVECIAFALVGNIIDSNRFEMFKNLFDLGYTEELLEDIKKLLIRYMSVS